MKHAKPADVPASRRRLLVTAGGLGLAAATGGVVAAVAARSGGDADATNRATADSSAVRQLDGPVVVHLADLATGTMDVFAGTTHIQVRDPELAARLARAATAS